ncbi:MAG: hypothetical protein ACSHX3_16855 [Litorimonas sp.]
MTREEIAARNRLNAQKSTGPKTARGKAIVAGNARRHGATARPDPELVATWLRIILDDPEIAPNALIPNDELGFRALTLAQAEARLVTAERSLRDFEAGMPWFLRMGKRFSFNDYIDARASGELSPPDMTLTQSEVYQLIQATKKEYQAAERGQRLLKRYLGEARTQRRKAFSAWVIASNREDMAA